MRIVLEVLFQTTILVAESIRKLRVFIDKKKQFKMFSLKRFNEITLFLASKYLSVGR